MQNVVMGILAVMLFTSLVLAVASLVWPASVKADFCDCAKRYSSSFCAGCWWITCDHYYMQCCYWQGCKWGWYCSGFCYYRGDRCC